jgi:hypothetical protein
MTLDEVYNDLLSEAASAEIDISSSEDAERFFTEIVTTFEGDKNEFVAYVRAKLPEWFRCITVRPLWIQNADWQFAGGKPMVFAGQFDVSCDAGWFHDDASFYTFWDPEMGDTKTVIQVS